MMSRVLRDHELAPDRVGVGAAALMARARDTLLQGWAVVEARRTRVRALVGHAVHFYTWRSLVHDGGLRSADAAALMTELVTCAAGRVSGAAEPTQIR